MASTEARHSGEPKTNRRDGVSITVKGGGHGGGLLILGGTLLAAAVGAAFAYHQSRANKKTTTPPAVPSAADKDFVTSYDGEILNAGGHATIVNQSLILNELASADGPAVESLASESVEAVRKPISEELPDVEGAEEIEQQVEKEHEGEGTESSVDEDDESGEEGSDGTGSSLVESIIEVAVWQCELIDNGDSPTRHDVVCTGAPAVESSASDIVEKASKQISEESPLKGTTDVTEIEQQVEMNIQEYEMSSITGTQGEGSNSSVDEEEEGEEEGSNRSTGLSSLESSAEAVVPAEQINDNCGKILLVGDDAMTELIRHDQVVSAEIFKAASEPIPKESPATDYVKEIEQLVELYLEEGDSAPILGSKGEGIDSSIDQSSTEAVWPEELINVGENALATEPNEKEEAQQYVLLEADNNEASVTEIVKGTSLPFMEESLAAVDVEEIEQILELNCKEDQIRYAAEPSTEAVWQAGLIDKEEKSSATELQEKEEPKQYILPTASQAATEELSVSEIVKGASEPIMEELPATGDVKEFKQQVDMNRGECGILLTIASQEGMADSAIDQTSIEAVCPTELINQEEKSLTTEWPEKEEPQQYVPPSSNQEAIEESYFSELVNGATRPIIEEIKRTVEVNHEEDKNQSIIGSQGEGTDSCVDEKDEGGDVESDGTGSFAVESSPEAIWPVEMTKEEERRPQITESAEKEKLRENVLLIASQSICTKTVALAATIRMTMRSNKVTHSRALVMLLALILVLGLVYLAGVDLH